MPFGQPGMGFVITFKGNLQSANPFVQIANEYVADGNDPGDLELRDHAV